jgi:hypothetical protein
VVLDKLFILFKGGLSDEWDDNITYPVSSQVPWFVRLRTGHQETMTKKAPDEHRVGSMRREVTTDGADGLGRG